MLSRHRPSAAQSFVGTEINAELGTLALGELFVGHVAHSGGIDNEGFPAAISENADFRAVSPRYTEVDEQLCFATLSPSRLVSTARNERYKHYGKSIPYS